MCGAISLVTYILVYIVSLFMYYTTNDDDAKISFIIYLLIYYLFIYLFIN